MKLTSLRTELPARIGREWRRARERFMELPLRRRRVIIVAAGVLLLALIFLGGGDGAADAGGPTAVVQRGPLRISVVETGSIRPHRQMVLRNEMDDDAAIVFIVPEGALVKKGDLIVELDATAVETELVERRIRVQNTEAELVYAEENMSVVRNQAMADTEAAELQRQFAIQDLQKYVEGEYPKQLKELEAAITLVEQELGQAQEELKWSETLFAEKYLSESDLQQDRLTARRVQLNLEMARADLALFQEYTHERQLAELRSAVRQTELALERTRSRAAGSIAQAEAQLRARQAQIEEEKGRLAQLEAEHERSRIYAPIDGMVLYASSVSNRYSNDPPVEEGTIIRERREIIHLPTADSYDIDISIPEVNLNKVAVGQPARVLVDSLPGVEFRGRISSIARLPDATSRALNPNLKLYNTVIELESGVTGIRSGMSCRVEIIVDDLDDAVYVPVQSVVQEAGRPVVYVQRRGAAVPVPVELGLDNNQFVHVVSGLEEGQEVLLAPPLDAGGEPPFERSESTPAEAADELLSENPQPLPKG